ncbi:hypothetical protein V1525DRAFT_405416 [Lipomyces kononenkoae]|uniref:Uncharacterized protein n=1 Tax=Lipomyces kononenkoae TaxID=34357 RepID=A0ACC3SZ44_LIPKO
MNIKNGFIASLGLGLILAHACLCAAEPTKLCLVKLSGLLGPLSKVSNDYWLLLENNLLEAKHTPFYDNRVIGVSNYVNVTVESQSSSNTALLYMYNNDGGLGKNIAFVKYNNKGYHFTTDDQFLGPIFIGSNDLGLSISLSFCMTYSYDWTYSPSSKVITPAGEVLVWL